MARSGLRMLLLSLLAGLCACTQHGADGTSDGGSAKGGPGSLNGEDAGVGAASGDGGLAGFKVTIAASAGMVCPGRCAQLTAAVFGGTAPYRFEWDEDLPETAQVSVCPSETTTYTVRVRDASVDSEFSQKNPEVSASLRIAVAAEAACEDGALIDAGTPSGGEREVCSLHAPVTAGGIVADMAQKNHASLVDRGGNVVVVGTFSGSMQVAEHTLVAGGPADGFVIKIDRDCNVLWARNISGDPAGQLWIGAVANDDESNVYVAGSFSGKTGIGDADVTPGGHAGFVLRLEADTGHIVWSKVYTSQAAAVAVTDLVVDAQHRLTMIGYAGADTSLGGAPLGFLYAASMPFLAQLKTDGTFGWSRTFTSGDLLYGLAISHYDDALTVTGWATKSVDFGKGAVSLGAGGRYLAKLSPLGTQTWLRALPKGADYDQWNWWKGGVVLDTWGNAIVLRDEPQTLPGDSGARVIDDSVEKYSLDGDPVWETRLSASTTFDAAWGNALAWLPDEHVVRFGSFRDTTTYAGETVVSRGENDVALVELSPDGEALSVYTMGGPLHERALAVAADYDGRVFASYVEYDDASGDNQELVIVGLTRH